MVWKEIEKNLEDLAMILKKKKKKKYQLCKILD